MATPLRNVNILQIRFILWRADPLLGKDRKIINNKIAVTEQRLHNQACFDSKNWKHQQRKTQDSTERFKKSFTIWKAYINVFKGHVQCFERHNVTKHTEFYLR
jgi:hypothetical protein